jgi:uncharacterized membrane protein YbhN (UPF0104 family)
VAAFGVGASFLIVTTRFAATIERLTAFLGWTAGWAGRFALLRHLIPQDSVARLNQLDTSQIDNRVSAQVFLLTILQTLVGTARAYLVARALGLHMPFLVLLLAAPLAQLGQMLAFTPGALGVRELSWIGVLQATGIPRDDLLVFVVGQRAYLYLSILALSLASHLIVTIWPQRAGSPVGAERVKT